MFSQEQETCLARLGGASHVVGDQSRYSSVLRGARIFGNDAKVKWQVVEQSNELW